MTASDGPRVAADVRRGQIYWVDWSPGRGSEQAGLRPALIVQADAANRSARYPNTIVVAISTRGRDVFTHVALDPDVGNGLRERSYAKCEQLVTVSKDRLQGCIGRVTADDMAKVARALRHTLALI